MVMAQTSYKDLKQYCYFSCLSDGALETVSNKFELVKLQAVFLTGPPLLKKLMTGFTPPLNPREHAVLNTGRDPD